LAAVSDKKIGHDAGGGTIDYYETDVVIAYDYHSRRDNHKSLLNPLVLFHSKN